MKPDLFNASNFLDYVVIDETPPSELDTFHDYLIGLWVIHPRAKLNQLENNLAILFLRHDVKFSGKLNKSNLNELKCSIIGVVAFFAFLDRIRPACLPLSQSNIMESISSLFRIVHVNSFKINKASAMKPIKYNRFKMEMCMMYFKGNISEKNVICASANSQLRIRHGAEGDPFVVKINGPQGTTPVYQVGLDVIHSSKTPGMFLNLYPYVQWIANTISEHAKNTSVEFE